MTRRGRSASAPSSGTRAASAPGGTLPERRILLFVRAPRPGRVKTRLTPQLGEQGAAFLYEALLDDTVVLCRATTCGARLELWATSVGWFRRRHPDLAVRRQAGADLGARLRSAFSASFADGADQVVIMGSDHPTLPAAYLDQAFAALGEVPLVIGPCQDGGYYLLGLRRGAWPTAAELLSGIPWSTDAVLSVTRERASGLAMPWAELPEWYDVDGPIDLARLRRDAPADSATARALVLLSGAAAAESGPGE